MRSAVALTLALSLACLATLATAQQRDVKPGTEAARETDRASRTKSVTGKVKATTEKGLVVVGREMGQKDDKEWAFAVDGATRIEAAGKPQVASALREGDPVTVTYTDRDGKVIAQNIKVSAQ